MWAAVSLFGSADEPAGVSTERAEQTDTVEQVEPTPSLDGSGADGSGRPAQAGRPGDDRPDGRRPDRSDRRRHPDRENRADQARRRPTVVTTRLEPAESSCEPGSVVVEPTVTGEAVAGEPVELRLALSSSSPVPCQLAIDAQKLLAQVSDGAEEPVWEAAQCPASIPEGDVVLRPGWQAMLTLPWSGHEGNPRCSDSTAPADPGTYAVQAAVIGGEPGRSEFLLSAPATDVAAPPPGAAGGAAARSGGRSGQT